MWISTDILQRFAITERIYTLLVHAYLCRYVRGEIHLHAHHEYALVTPRELYSYQFEAADQPILDMLQENAL